MGHESLLEGLTIAEGFDYNIYGGAVDFTVNNCVIRDGLNYGIYAEYGDVTVTSSMIRNNGADGIYHESIANSLNISNSWVLRNNKYGIRCDGSTPTIKNSIISESDLSEEGNEGIRMLNPAFSPILYNNTISNNNAAGIYFEDDQGSDPNIMPLDYPDIQNCIIYYNNNDGQQLSGIDADYAYYSCIQDCNDINPNYNINDIPSFAYPVDPAGTPDPNNYHLAYDSACRNQGNPSLDYSGQVDYDKEDRVIDGQIDMGADELYSCDDSYSEDDFANENDWNADGIVNLKEFKKISSSWLTNDPASPPGIADPNTAVGWNPLCNLDDSGDSQYTIDLADLSAFVADVPWLWKACWYDNYMAAMEGSQASAIVEEPTAASSLESAARAVAASSLDLQSNSKVYDMYEGLTNAELAEIVSNFRYLQDCVIDKLTSSKGKDKKDLQDILDFFDGELAKIADSLQ